jgi:hypothetical protein
VHGCGDRVVSTDQLKRLVPGTRVVEQGGNDRGDVGAGDRATGDRRGASRTLPVADASVRLPGRTMVQSRSRARRSSSAAVFAAM